MDGYIKAGQIEGERLDETADVEGKTRIRYRTPTLDRSSSLLQKMEKKRRKEGGGIRRERKGTRKGTVRQVRSGKTSSAVMEGQKETVEYGSVWRARKEPKNGGGGGRGGKEG